MGNSMSLIVAETVIDLLTEWSMNKATLNPRAILDMSDEMCVLYTNDKEMNNQSIKDNQPSDGSIEKLKRE